MRNEFNPELIQVVQQDFPETVPEVIKRMAEIQDAVGGFASARPLAAFNFLYKDITSTILRVLNNSENPIENQQGAMFNPNPLANLLHRSVERLEVAELLPAEPADPADRATDEIDDGTDRAAIDFKIQPTTAIRAEETPSHETPGEGAIDPNFQSLRSRLAQAFMDPPAMAALDVEFARMYFRALRAWATGGQVAHCWEALFQKWDDADGEGPFTGALLGVNAHINHDLAIAVQRTHEQLGDPITDGSDRHADYLTINDVFLVQTPLLYEQLKGVLVGPKVIFWELVGAGPMEQASQFLLKETRDLAWDHAKRLEADAQIAASDDGPEMAPVDDALIDPTNDAIAGAVADGILAAFF